MSEWMWRRRRQVWRCRTPTEQTLLLCNPLLLWVCPDLDEFIIKKKTTKNGQIIEEHQSHWQEVSRGRWGRGKTESQNSELAGLEPERRFFPLQEIHKAFFIFFLNFSVCWWRRWFWHMLANDDDWRDCGCFLSKEAVCVETKYTWQPTCLQSEFKARICRFLLWCKSFFFSTR